MPVPSDTIHPSMAGAPWEPELRAAVHAARLAGVIQMERLGRLEHIVHKSAKDVVTEADHLSEEAILGTIRERFPADQILAEESGHSGSKKGRGPSDGSGAAGSVDAAHRIWIVDPLDGTVNYANALPFFCASVGLVVGGQPMVGAVLDPVRDELYSAVRGVGAWRNGEPVHHAGKERLVDTVSHVAFPGTGWARREARFRKAIRVGRVFGSAALALAYLADDRFDSFIQARGLSLWDIAAAGLIAEESGAIVTDTAGGPWFDLSRRSAASGVVAASPAHHAEIIRMLRPERDA
jgi:myo-inositol-1(or 4)-monophosphatase